MNYKALMSAVVELSRTAGDHFAIDDLLRRLVEVAADSLAVDGAGVMVGHADSLRFLHSHSRRGAEVVRLERLQELLQLGPCQDAVISGREVIIEDMAEHPDAEWTLYLQEAQAVGLHSVVAMPLISRGRGWGVLDLYRHRPGPWTEWEMDGARVLANLAVSFLVMAADRDDAVEAHDQLAYRSMHDDLTGLPNRTLLFDRLSHALSIAARHDRTVAVFFIDLDDFKQINDSFGHAAGDVVLAQTAQRMASTLRAEDTLGRLSGDEFVLVCGDLPRQPDGGLDRELGLVADRIHSVMAGPIHIAGADVVISASIGVALGDSQVSADDLLADADAAMYRVKHKASNDTVPAASIGARRRHGRQLEHEFEQVFVHRQLRVHYQPIVSTAEAGVRAVEALLRWDHPTRGRLAAAEFIKIAYGNGSIVPIGHWVIEQTCAQIRQWKDCLEDDAPNTGYVNLTSRQLKDPALQHVVAGSLERHGLMPEMLGMELVEDSFVDPHLVETLQSYRKLGHPLAVDDFGTGASSLLRLVDLPVDLVKIDRSFVAGMVEDPRRRAVVAAVMLIAGTLDLDVVGEGVETAEQAALLSDSGCYLQQGYYHGSPKAAETLVLSHRP